MLLIIASRKLLASRRQCHPSHATDREDWSRSKRSDAARGGRFAGKVTARCRMALSAGLNHSSCCDARAGARRKRVHGPPPGGGPIGEVSASPPDILILIFCICARDTSIGPKSTEGRKSTALTPVNVHQWHGKMCAVRGVCWVCMDCDVNVNVWYVSVCVSVCMFLREITTHCPSNAA